MIIACSQPEFEAHKTTGLRGSIDPPPPGATSKNENDSENFGFDDDQLVTMFRAAIAQTYPFAPQKALCVVLVRTDHKTSGAPRLLRERLAAELGIPTYPVSQCSLDTVPKVIASGAQAMLYQVQLEPPVASCATMFTATATFGNLGAKGQQFCLRNVRGRWIAEPTGLTVVS